jgi:hypothetical protein
MPDEPPETEQRIRIWAYHLWEHDGRPFGRDNEYWARAKALAGNDNEPGAPAPAPEQPREG